MSYYNEYGAFYEEQEEFHEDLKEILGKVESENSNNNESIEVSLAVKEETDDEKSKEYKCVKNLIKVLGDNLEILRKRKIATHDSKYLRNIMKGKGNDDINYKCNFYSPTGTKDVYERVVNGVVSYLLWALMVIEYTGTTEDITPKKYKEYLETLPMRRNEFFDKQKRDVRSSYNDLVSDNFCAVVESTTEGLSHFKGRIIVTEPVTLKLDGKYDVTVKLPVVLADITTGLDGKPWTKDMQKELVKSYIEKWGKVSKLNKRYYKFGVL